MMTGHDITLIVDGETEHADEIRFETPNIVYTYEVPGETAVRRALGASGVGITLIRPNDRLLAMHQDGITHKVTLIAAEREFGPVDLVFVQLLPSAAGSVLFGQSPHEPRPIWRAV